MFVRLKGELIDLREVRNVTRNGNIYQVQYENGSTKTIVTENNEPQHTLDLANALMTIFDNIEV